MTANQIGGKALSLFRLWNGGFQVPPFFAVSADAFRTVMQADANLLALVEQVASQKSQQPRDLEAQIRQLQSAISDCPLPNKLLDEIATAYKTVIPSQSMVAIRSSASDEDGADHSFAGMHDSFMYVPDLESVIDSLRKVWASAFNRRAIAYRQENGLDVQKIAVSVVIQQMIDARSSGVIFTINPANNKTNQVVISAVWGAGEGLVSHGLAADTFVIDKRGLTVETSVAEKSRQLLLDTGQNRGLFETDVPAAEQNVACLQPNQIEQLAEQAMSIEKYYRRPQDIEFCIDASDELYVLQSRPVTRVAEYGPAAGNRLVWDNSNIIESYSGVTTPLTFSFIRRAYTIVYHCFAEVMGISDKKVHDSRHVFENMLGLIRGRVYYNLQNWYRLIRLFPGFDYNAQFMESMMGLKEPLVLDDPVAKPSLWKKWFVELPALIRLVIRTLWNFIRIRPIVDQFQSSFHECYARWDKMDFQKLAPHELKSLYHEMEDALLWNWRAPIINDFYVMIYYGLLKKLCETWCHDKTGSLQNDLICGEGGVESAEPAKMLLRLAGVAASEPELVKLIFEDPLEQVPERIKKDDRFPEFNQLMRKYLDLYGFRCMNELKLEEFSLRDRPHVVYQVLRNYLSLEDKSALDVDAMHQREQRVRREAEFAAFGSIRGFSLLPRTMIFKRVLRNARQGVKNRENMRFARTRIYGIVRELFRALGHQMADESILNDCEDIFYLTVDEVWDFIKGTAVTTHLNPLAELRRSEFNDFQNEEHPDGVTPDDRFETFGFVYHKNRFQNHAAETVQVEDGQLVGTGCCPGKLTNRVRVLRTPTGRHGTLG